MNYQLVLDDYFKHNCIASFEGSIKSLSLQISRALNTFIDEKTLLLYFYQNSALKDYRIIILIHNGEITINLTSEY